MSSTTLVNLEKLSDRDDTLFSNTPTPGRRSLDTIRDEEKLPQEPESSDDTPQLSKMRLVLLMLGLTLSIFLVALDFVRLVHTIPLIRQNILTTAIPRITDDFRDLNSVAWVRKPKQLSNS